MRKKINKKIKITYLVDFFRTINAGTERQIGHLLTHLPEFGYSVQLISLQDSAFLRNEAPLLFPKVPIKTLGARSDVSKSLPALAGLFWHLRKAKPDVVHTFFPASNSFGILIAWLAGIRTVLSSRRDMGYNLTKTDIALLKIANCFVSGVVTNSRAVQIHTIQQEGIAKAKTRVIYNGISLEEFNELPDEGGLKPPVIGIVANLNRQVKRVDLFLNAAALLHRALPDLKFWIIGDGWFRSDLEQLSSNVGLDSNAVFMGRRDDVQDILSKMNVGVICSDSEGFSNAIMEYMACGIPVVATNVGGNAELVEHGKTGLLVPPGDHKALARAILICVQNYDFARIIGLEGRRKLFRNFSKEKMLRATEDLYEEILNDLNTCNL